MLGDEEHLDLSQYVISFVKIGHGGKSKTPNTTWTVMIISIQ